MRGAQGLRPILSPTTVMVLASANGVNYAVVPTRGRLWQTSLRRSRWLSAQLAPAPVRLGLGREQTNTPCGATAGQHFRSCAKMLPSHECQLRSGISPSCHNDTPPTIPGLKGDRFYQTEFAGKLKTR